MQRAADSGRETRAVQEDAGALVFARAQVRFTVVLVHLQVALSAEALFAELPVHGCQLLDGVVEPGAVYVVGQERTV